jgi:mannitol 2-dehydrogenase
MKIRLLNASHLLIGYLGTLAGYSYVHEVMADPLIRQAVERLMAEVTPTLQSVPGIDLDQYKKTLIERFANPKIRDQLPRVSLNGSAKLPKWVLSSLRDKLRQDGAIDYLSLTIAAWFRYLNGQDDQGQPITVDDPMADILTQRARAGSDPKPLLSLTELFGDLSQSSRFVESVTDHLRNLYEIGTKETLVQLLRGQPDRAN